MHPFSSFFRFPERTPTPGSHSRPGGRLPTAGSGRKGGGDHQAEWVLSGWHGGAKDRTDLGPELLFLQLLRVHLPLLLGQAPLGLLAGRAVEDSDGFGGWRFKRLFGLWKEESDSGLRMYHMCPRGQRAKRLQWSEELTKHDLDNMSQAEIICAWKTDVSQKYPQRKKLDAADD